MTSTEQPLVKNREAWLTEAVEALRPLFRGQNLELPPIRVSVGFPSRGAMSKQRVIGQCWGSEASKDGSSQIFISPLLEYSVEVGGNGVLPTLTHELLHAAIGVDQGHGPKFARLCKKLGLEGKATHTHAGIALSTRLMEMAEALGPFPHVKLSPLEVVRKKQTTRMIKCECEVCGYLARTTRAWIEKIGAPLCPCNKEKMFVASPKDETDE